MAKGAKRKTKWVSLSLASANTTTSVATGSDSEQTHHQQHLFGGAHRQKTLNRTGTKHSASKESAGGTDSAEEHHSNEPLDHSGNRTDTSGSTSDGTNGHSAPDRRNGGAYQRRRPPPYHTRSSWNGDGAGTGGAPNGRATYNGGGGRSGYYNGGGAGYYGTGRRSHYDTHTRRPANATGTNTTTSGEGGGGGGTTINDDEYTRITTPRQDVLFKKGYLSRPKPGVAGTAATATSTSNENTASSSIAGTASEGSDGGNGGGSNSISTTESITSEYGGSYAADGSPLFDYPYPLLPCGYFTENGVLVMNGFAVDNNGYSYFNGGQTYIYPPNFSNCQQPQPHPTEVGGVQPTDSIPYPLNDETNANNTGDHPDVLVLSTPGMDSQTVTIVANGAASFSDDSCSVDGHGVLAGPPVEQYEAVVEPTVLPVEGADEQDVLLLNGDPIDPGAAGDGAVEGETAVLVPPQVPDYENGYYHLNDAYDLTQFYSSIYYSNWLMEQYRLFDDAAAPLYCGGDYATPSGDVYTHHTSFKRRKKRNRTFDGIPGENGTSYDLGEMTNSIVHEIYPMGDAAAPVGPVSSSGEASSHELNTVVQEFQPATNAATPLQSCVATAQSEPEVGQHTPTVTKKPPPAAKHVKSSLKTLTVFAPAEPNVATTAASTARPAAMVHKIRKKDLIESTRAFAEQNIDLTRPKVLAAPPSSLDSELECWTTVDRNGRKKRLDQPSNRNGATSATPTSKERNVPAKERAVKAEQRPVVEKVSPPPTTDAVLTALPSSSTSSTLDAASSDTSNKKDEQNAKSKKKTKPNKRQQHRKSAGGFHKQHKQEGFQLIEPDFPSAALFRRARSCDDANQKDELEEELEQDTHEERQSEEQLTCIEQELPSVVEEATEKHTQKQETVIVPLEEGIEEQRAEERCIVAEDIGASVELICDKANEMVPAGATQKMETIGEQVKEVAQDLVLTTLPPPPSVAVVVEEKIVVNETETEQFVEHAPESINAQKVQKVAKESVDPVECTMCNVEQLSPAPAVPIGQTDCEPASKVVGVVELEEQEMCEEPIAEPLSFTLPMEDPVPKHEKLAGAQSPAAEEQLSELSMDRDVLTSAAKQLALGEKTNMQHREAKDNDSEEGEGDTETSGVGGGSEGGESRGKRGSVSGVGYTESIDSGLQSPAPCGGVASPEASSMVSSIESDDAPLGQPQPEAQLSQIVAKWLLRKLEVHDLEEVFVLPSDPLLLQRLERFQLLQGRACRLRGLSCSDSEEDDGSQEDTDSDYMSDGQGRLDRTAAGDESSDTNPSSPVNSADVVPLPVGQKTVANGAAGPTATADDDEAPSMHLDAKITRPSEKEASSKPYGLSSSDSRSINSQTIAASDSKRCVIM